jgi:hypothetical protein
MNAGAIIAIIAVCVMVIGQFVGVVFGLLMMEEVDRGKPELNLYSLFGSLNRRWLRGFELIREYRGLCPEGKLHIYELACLAIAAIGWITLVILGVISIASHRIE